MATVKLILPKPVNTALQAKAVSTSLSTSQLDNGAWDIIYFARMENGKQTGEIQRLGKCIDIITSPNEYDSCILLIKDSFSDPLPEHQ